MLVAGPEMHLRFCLFKLLASCVTLVNCARTLHAVVGIHLPFVLASGCLYACRLWHRVT